MEFWGQADERHINGNKLSQVPKSQDWNVEANVAATHSPDIGSGWCNDQKPEYCEIKAPEADSKVLVLNSSNEAKPNQYLSEARWLGSLKRAIVRVSLFSANVSMATSSAPYLLKRETKRETF